MPRSNQRLMYHVVNGLAEHVEENGIGVLLKILHTQCRGRCISSASQTVLRTANFGWRACASATQPETERHACALMFFIWTREV
ncbi:hypothetical protein GJAV_G00250670 [Gymnothorax javanicus]|nr:hypothetical protein GJAV_G00250670 [Gymnothorax javanicus]